MDYINYYKQMRIILIYDLPMTDDEERRIYNKFHKNLGIIGFHMMQYSVYSKVIQNESVYKQMIIRLNKVMPKKGNILLFRITEKQYQDIVYLNGIKNRYEFIVGGNELVVFGGDDNFFNS